MLVRVKANEIIDDAELLARAKVRTARLSIDLLLISWLDTRWTCLCGTGFARAASGHTPVLEM